MNSWPAPRALSRRQLFVAAGGLGCASAALALAGACVPRLLAPPPRVPKVGVITYTLANAPVTRDYQEAWRQGLQAYGGYEEGRTLLIERRATEGRPERTPEILQEFTSLPVDAIVTTGTAFAQAATRATSTIPVIAMTADPVGDGLASSLAHPGGNFTGVTTFSPQLSAKRLQILQEVLPGLTRVAVMWNPEDPSPRLAYEQTLQASPSLGIQLQSLPVRQPADLEPAFEEAKRGQAQALLTLGDPMLTAVHQQIVEFANQNDLPSMFNERFFVDAGGLMAYGPNLPALYGRIPYYLDRVLSGAKPADLPIEQPVKFEFVINQRTAQALGLTFPRELLLAATDAVR